MSLVLTSCLEGGLEDLPTYTGNEITSLQGVYYRYYSTEVIPGSGEVAVNQVSLTVSDIQLDPTNATLNCTASLPTDFSESQAGDFSMNKLIVVVNISAAAIIEPVGEAPALGTPGDWSKPNQYRVIAANGDEKTWTIAVNLK